MIRIMLLLTEPEPADLQWLGQKFGLDYNLMMCYDIANILANSMEFGNSYVAMQLIIIAIARKLIIFNFEQQLRMPKQLNNKDELRKYFNRFLSITLHVAYS